VVEPYTSETFARMEKERFRQEAGPLVEKAKEFLDSVIEAKEFWAGGDYPLEQVLLQADWDWERLPLVIKDEFLKGMGEYLGIDLLNPPQDKLIREDEIEGAKGSPTEGMTASVQVFSTRFAEIELHRSEYPEPVGIRYSLFYTSKS
jgi:hypothetical protein